MEDIELVGASVEPDQPGGGNVLGLLGMTAAAWVVRVAEANGGGAIGLTDDELLEAGIVGRNTVAIAVLAGRVDPVCAGVSVGVKDCTGVDVEDVSKSSQDMTSNASPPLGISRATCVDLAEPTRAAKSTSPDAVSPEVFEAPDVPAT